MVSIPLEKASEQLSELMEQALAGQRILITRPDGRIVELKPVSHQKKKPVFGLAKEKILIHDDFDDPIGGFEKVM